MIDVNQDTKNIYKVDGVHKNITIIVGSYTFTNDDIVDESVELSQSIFDGDDMDVCGCIASKMSFKVYFNPNNTLPTRGNDVVLKIQAPNTQEITLFTGKMDDCSISGNDHFATITSYDMFYTLSGQGNTDQDLGDPYDITKWFNEHVDISIAALLLQVCTKFNIRVAGTISKLINGDVISSCGRVHKASNLSALDLIKDIFRINGVFGFFNNIGFLDWINLTASPYGGDGTLYPSELLFPDSYTYPGTDPSHGASQDPGYISTYETLEYKTFDVKPVQGVVVADYEDDKNAGRSEGVIGGNIYKIYGNLCILGKDKTTKQRIANYLYSRLNSITYVPYKSKSYGLPYIQCGDSVTFYDPKKQKYIKTFVMSRMLKISQHMTDDYSATGDQYVHTFKVGTERDTSNTSAETQAQIDDLYERADSTDDDILNLNQDIADINDDYEALTDDYEDYKVATNQAIDEIRQQGLQANIKIVSEVPANPAKDTLYLIKGDTMII